MHFHFKRLRAYYFAPFLFHLIYHEHVLMFLGTFIPGQSSWLPCLPLHGSAIMCLASHFPIVGHLADMPQSSQENKPHMLF